MRGYFAAWRFIRPMVYCDVCAGVSRRRLETKLVPMDSGSQSGSNLSRVYVLNKCNEMKGGNMRSSKTLRPLGVLMILLGFGGGLYGEDSAGPFLSQMPAELQVLAAGSQENYNRIKSLQLEAVIKIESEAFAKCSDMEGNSSEILETRRQSTFG